MLDSPPPESEKTSWAYVALAVIVIYSTIPVARALRDFVDTHVGRWLFLLFAAVLALLVAAAAVASLRRRQLPPGAYAWTFAVLLTFAGCIYQLRNIPEEALHLAEYGVLGLLVYRALSHRLRDFGIYPVAAVIVGTIGLLDEYLQWLMPDRVFDLRDIAINLLAGVLTQVAIALGLRPRIIAGAPGRRSLSRLCFAAAAAVILLTLGMQNTPPRVTRYAAQFEALEFLLHGRSMMAEYGYRHEDADIGVFFSRFTVAELAALDRQRGVEVAAVLDRYIRGEGYRQFLQNHSVMLDPYAHEAGVHLFRRERYIDRARENADRAGEFYHVAWRENLILEKYFTRAINHSRHDWDSATELEVGRAYDRSLTYASAVSANIITRVSATQVLWAGAGAAAALIIAGWRLQKSSRADL